MENTELNPLQLDHEITEEFIEKEELELVPEESEPVVPKKKTYKKKKGCKNCPDYSKEDLYTEKILAFRSKGYNNNQIASMLGLHKQFVDSI